MKFGSAVLAAVLAVAPAAADVDISLSASPGSIQVGSQSVVSVYCDNPGTEFNAYELLISWDTTKLDLTSWSEGSYMTGICGNTFLIVDDEDAEVLITHSLLCLNAYCSAQGNVFHLTFTGVGTGTSNIQVETADFRRAGLPVTVGDITECSIQVTGPGGGSGGCPGGCEMDKPDHPVQATWGRAKEMYK